VSFKRFRVRVAEVEHEVEVETRADGTHEVRVDGHAHDVEPGPNRSWLVTSRTSSARRTVVLEPGARPGSACTAGIVADVEVRTAQEAALAEALAVAAGPQGGNASIRAPMPGRVVRVLVAQGETIDEDQPLVIVEAMKMENEVRAPAAGTVSSVRVIAGETVEAGALLVELSAG
jgi:biotin carboxyl carrier protein